MAKTTNKKGTTTPPLVDENDVSTAVKANSPDKKQSLANSPDKKQPLVSAITAGKTSATATTRAASKGRTSSQAHLATITHGAANAERPHRPVMQPPASPSDKIMSPCSKLLQKKLATGKKPKINPLLQKAMLNARRPAPSSTLASKEDMLEEADI